MADGSLAVDARAPVQFSRCQERRLGVMVSYLMSPIPGWQLWVPISQFLLGVVLPWKAWLSLVLEAFTSSVWFWESPQGT